MIYTTCYSIGIIRGHGGAHDYDIAVICPSTHTRSYFQQTKGQIINVIFNVLYDLNRKIIGVFYIPVAWITNWTPNDAKHYDLASYL